MQRKVGITEGQMATRVERGAARGEKLGGPRARQLLHLYKTPHDLNSKKINETRAATVGS